MKHLITGSLLAILIGCGGSETSSAPTKTEEHRIEEPKVETTKAPEPAKSGEPDLATMSEADRTAWLIKHGEEVYKNGSPGGVACTSCHQENGQGLPGAFPPLVGQKEIMGDCVRHAGFVVHGLNGEITVNGQKFNGAMPAQATMSDIDIAAAISYERMSWGNDYGVCLPEDVKKARSAPAPTLK